MTFDDSDLNSKVTESIMVVGAKRAGLFEKPLNHTGFHVRPSLEKGKKQKILSECQLCGEKHVTLIENAAETQSPCCYQDEQNTETEDYTRSSS